MDQFQKKCDWKIKSYSHELIATGQKQMSVMDTGGMKTYVSMLLAIAIITIIRLSIGPFVISLRENIQSWERHGGLKENMIIWIAWIILFLFFRKIEYEKNVIRKKQKMEKMNLNYVMICVGVS